MPSIEPAAGAILESILDETWPLWGEGLSREAYGRFNRAQSQTPYGRRHLRRLALLDDDGRVLSSAKRYEFSARVDGEVVRVLGIGAVFTPAARRGQGHAAALIERLLQRARDEGIGLAVLFSEIGATYYARLGFAPFPIPSADVQVSREAGAPAIVVRTVEDRDAPFIAEAMRVHAAGYRFALLPDEDLVRYSTTKKRLLAGLSPPGLRSVEHLVAEEGGRAVASVLVQVAHGRAGRPEHWSLEACADRDPSGARVGAILQVMLARAPSGPAPLIRGWWPHNFTPPQVRLIPRPSPSIVPMFRWIESGRRLDPPLRAEDVWYWHGDSF